MTLLPSRRAGVRVRLVVADDHTIVRQAVSLLLASAGFHVVGQASNGREAVGLVRERTPDIAILDFVMPLLNGLDAAREIRQAAPRTSVILLTSRHDERLMLEAIQAGIRGFVQKTHEVDDLVQAVLDVASGGVHLNPALSRCMVAAFRMPAGRPPDPLSPREHEVLELIADGRRMPDIARRLGVSVRTAEAYRARLRMKLRIREAAALVRAAGA